MIEDVLSIAMAVVFTDALITRADFGFDLWWARTVDLAAGGDFSPITFDGFRRVATDSQTGFSFEGNYNPTAPYADGVRNMVCHPGKHMCLLLFFCVWKFACIHTQDLFVARH